MTYDPKSRSNLASMLREASTPLVRPATARYYDPPKWTAPVPAARFDVLSLSADGTAVIIGEGMSADDAIGTAERNGTRFARIVVVLSGSFVGAVR